MDMITYFIDHAVLGKPYDSKEQPKPKPVMKEYPISIDMRTHMKFLHCQGDALSQRWKEKVEEKNRMWAGYKVTELACNPELFWNYLASTAKLMAETEKWRQEVEGALGQIQPVIERFYTEHVEILNRKNAELADSRTARYSEIANLKDFHEQTLQSERELCQKEIEDLKASHETAVASVRMACDEKTQNLGNEWRNKFEVSEEARKNWQRKYLKKRK